MDNSSINIPTMAVIGGSGLIGRALARHFSAKGWRIIISTRHPEKTERALGSAYTYCQNLSELTDSEQPDIIINLAGESVGAGRWTAKRKQALLQSRLEPTQQLGNWLKQSQYQPKLIIQASAVGYYGNGDAKQRRIADETASAGEGFSAELCAKWEQVASTAAKENHVPLAICRFGVVLSQDGGILRQLLTPVRLCVGKIGTGQQPLNWIHIADVANAIEHIIAQNSSADIRYYNLTAPILTTQYAFAQSAAAILRRPLIFGVPAAIMRMVLGEQADLVLEGEFVTPSALQTENFVFQFPDADSALQNLL